MSRINTIQGAFSAGEVSPRLFGRVDLEKFQTGLAECTNFILQPQGGIYRRPPSIYVAPTRYNNKNVTLIPFTAQDKQAYVVEASNLYFRYYTNLGQLVSGMSPVQTTTPYLDTEVSQIDYAQSADTLFLAHGNHPPQYLQRTSSTSFALTPFNFQDGPYMTLNTDNTKLLQPTGFTQMIVTDETTLVVSNVYYGDGQIVATGFAPFVSTDVGRWIRIRYGANWGACQITGFVNSTTVNAHCFAWDRGSTVTYNRIGGYPFGAPAGQYPPAVQDWQLGSWSNTTGWPQVVTFAEGRIWFACTTTEPQGVWSSESAIFNQFSPTNPDVTVVDSNGIGYTLNSTRLNTIQYMISGRSLMIGTYGADWCVRASSASAPLTPTNIAFQQQTSFGAAKVRPFLIGTSIIYVQRSTQKLREQTYDWSIDGYVSTEISLLSEHLIREGGGIIQAAFQQEPDSVWWGVRADGCLIGMTYMKDQKIVGFHRHVIGGSYQGGQAKVLSICTIPHPDGTQDQLWMVVQRTINGVTALYVEYMDKPFNPESPTDISEMNFVDCSFAYSGTPITHVTGLNPLIGQTVAICGDGIEQPTRVVANDGTIDLQSAASLLFIGLPYTSQGQSLMVTAQGDAGTSQGKIKRIDRIYIRVLNSMTFKIGPDYSHLTQKVFTNTSSLMDTAVPLVTDDVEVYHGANYDRKAQFVFMQDKPYPLNILAFVPQLVIAP